MNMIFRKIDAAALAAGAGVGLAPLARWLMAPSLPLIRVRHGGIQPASN